MKEVNQIVRVSFESVSKVSSKSYKDVIKDPTLSHIGEGKGLGFRFYEDEIIVFPTLDDPNCYVGTPTYKGVTYLTIKGWSYTRNRFVDIALSTFRRRPIEEDSKRFYTIERSLNVLLAEARADIDRFRILCETGAIQCTRIWDDCMQPHFNQMEDGKWEIDPNRTDPITLFEVQPYKLDNVATTAK